MDHTDDSLIDYSSRYEKICQRLARSLSGDDIKNLKFALRNKVEEKELKKVASGQDFVKMLERRDILSEQKLLHVRSLLKDAGIERVDDIIQPEASTSSEGLSKKDIYDIRSMKVVSHFKETIQLRKMVDIVQRKRAVLIKGPNGSGKSQCAFWYARKFQRENPSSVVWRVHCKSEKSVYLSFATLMSYLKIECILPDNDTRDCIDTMLELALRNLTNRNNARLKHLIVLDDMDSPEDINVHSAMERFIVAENIYVIATSNKRFSRDHFDLYGMKMDRMTEDEAVSLFVYTSKSEEDEVKLLARNLDYLPLALSLAASYINITHISVKEYNTNLLDSQLQADSLGKQSLARSYSMTLQRLDDQITNSARRVLSLVPYLSHNNISVTLLKSFLPEELSPSEREVEINKLLLALTDYSLATVEGVGEKRILSVHGVSCLMIVNAKSEARITQDVNFLLRHYCYYLDTDARLVESMKNNICFIHHAVYLLKKYRDYFDLDLFETKIYECYLCCAVAVTFRLYGSTELSAEDYFARAKHIIFNDILSISVPEKALHTGAVSKLEDYLYGSLIEQEEARQVYLKILEVSKTHLTTHFIERFLTKKVRSSREIQLLTHYGKINPKELRNKRLPMNVIKTLITEDIIIPLLNIRDTFLIDLLITIMNNSSKNKWWMETSKDSRTDKSSRQGSRTDSLTEFRFAHNLGQYLNLYFRDNYPACNPLANTGTKRNGILAFLRSNEKIDSDELRDVITTLDEMYNKSGDSFYVSFGVLKMAPEFSLHHRCLITRMLVKCYVKLWENDADQNDLSEALFQADKLAGLANEMNDWVVLSSVYLEIAQTYLLNPTEENIHHAKVNYKLACLRAKEGGNIINTQYHLKMYGQYIDFCLKYGALDDLRDAELICIEMVDRFIHSETKETMQKRLKKIQQKKGMLQIIGLYKRFKAGMVFFVALIAFSFMLWMLYREPASGDL